MKVVIAIDSFKGCLTSVEANRAAAAGIASVCPDAEVLQIPVSDGGEGWLEAFHAAIGGQFVSVATCDPLGRPIVADYLVRDTTAVIELARASGLTLLKPEERDVEHASSEGTVRLIADAVRRGCTQVIVGLGGSATCDYGVPLLDQAPLLSPQGGRIVPASDMRSVRFIAATDVRNPLFGPDGAAHVFAPQKGASPDAVERIEAAGRRLASAVVEDMGVDCTMREGAGAAGGFGWAMMQFLGADVVSGAELLLDSLNFGTIIQDADLVITGEGSADRQTLMGKLPHVIMQRATRAHVPVILIAGRINDRPSLIDAGFRDALCINPVGLSVREAMRKVTATGNIQRTCREIMNLCACDWHCR